MNDQFLFLKGQDFYLSLEIIIAQMFEECCKFIETHFFLKQNVLYT
jgi:hypothetical protein